jgi:hypothetical protein
VQRAIEKIIVPSCDLAVGVLQACA